MEQPSLMKHDIKLQMKLKQLKIKVKDNSLDYFQTLHTKRIVNRFRKKKQKEIMPLTEIIGDIFVLTIRD